MDSNLEGKSALITGAFSGIGEAAARLLTAPGCNTVLVARREVRPNTLAREPGYRAIPNDAVACEKLVEKTVDRFCALDVLVNNAGLGIDGSTVEGDRENRRTPFDVNVSFREHETA